MVSGTVLAPVTPRVAELLHALQGELLRAPAPESPLPGTIVLAARPGSGRVRFSDDGLQASVQFDGSALASFKWHTYRAQPEWARAYGPLCCAPGRWRVEETRRDERGQRWSSVWDNDLCDDGFGNLVEVSA